ncbi:MAG TPA: P1 family peptidase [Candidatus Limnocylindria bacterium]|nr:P1 family peptidase [Candidatus Limnocylindria bacterium]
MPRAADLGIRIGLLPSGPTNSVLDVPGVGLGHATVSRDEPDPPEGRGVARTGVTVLRLADDAFTRPIPAGGAVLNGAGELTGLTTAREWRLLETPILLTSTMQLGRVYDAACVLMLEEEEGVHEQVVIPVVGECDDSWLNDIRRMQVTEDDVRVAWLAAKDSVGSLLPPAEGAVGSGTGMVCLGFKGGIGTASRVVPSGHTVAVLLMTNFGERDRLTVDGVPVGRLLPESVPGWVPNDEGSCIGIVVTDAPLDGADCARLARRVGLGLARAGSVASHGSGEIFLAAATGVRADRTGALQGTPLTGSALNPFFEAVVEASEEAVLNSMLMATTTQGWQGRVAHALPAEPVRDLLVTAGRIPADPA